MNDLILKFYLSEKPSTFRMWNEKKQWYQTVFRNLKFILPDKPWNTWK